MTRWTTTLLLAALLSAVCWAPPLATAFIPTTPLLCARNQSPCASSRSSADAIKISGKYHSYNNSKPGISLTRSLMTPHYMSSTGTTPDDTTATATTSSSTMSNTPSIGDDVAAFDFSEQRLDEWLKFTAATGTVLAIVAYTWFWPGGPALGDQFLETTQSLFHATNDDPAVTMLGMLSIFAVAHSGLAGLRTYAEPIVGARAWRVLFAVVSLPLALSCLSFFINHAHDGKQLWQLPYADSPAVHALLWLTNFISFIFLYPSTFNLLEIAAIQTPQLHLYAPVGIMRITRHPQMVGQVMWCAAHTAYLGTSTALAASTVLVLHHVFSVYHGDRRLQTRHGAEAFEYIKAQTSVVPFAAIWEGRQVLPDDYYKEFLRGPYFLVVGGTMAAYLAHPWMQAGAALLGW